MPTSAPTSQRQNGHQRSGLRSRRSPARFRASSSPDLTAAARPKRAHGRRLYPVLSGPSKSCADRRWCVPPRCPRPNRARSGTKVDYESHVIALDRNELGALLAAAGLGPPAEHSLISLLAFNGLRASEATGADVEHLGLERGHRTLTITRQGGKVVSVPLAPRTARAIDLAIGERTDGPVLLAADGRRLDRHGAGRIVRQVARRAGTTKAVTPHTLDAVVRAL